MLLTSRSIDCTLSSKSILCRWSVDGKLKEGLILKTIDEYLSSLPIPMSRAAFARIAGISDSVLHRLANGDGIRPESAKAVLDTLSKLVGETVTRDDIKGLVIVTSNASGTDWRTVHNNS